MPNSPYGLCAREGFRLSSSAAKKDDQQFAESVDLPSTANNNDREQGLSQNFQDPPLEDLMLNLVPSGDEPAPVSVMQETVEAVQDLVTEAQGGPSIDLSADFGSLDLQLSPGSGAEEAAAAAPVTPMEAVKPPALPAITPDANVGEPSQLLFLNTAEGNDAAPAFDPDPAPAGMSSDAPADSVEAESAQILDLSAALGAAPAAAASISAPEDSVESEPSVMLSVSNHQQGDLGTRGQWEMAEKLFQLVVCERSFDDLVEAALTAIMGALEAQAGSVLEQDHEQQNYFFRCSIGGGDPEKVKAFRVPFLKGIVGHVGESKQSVLLADLEEDQKQMRAISMSVGFEAKTCMAAPIIVGGQLYGVIELFNRRQGGFFTEHDLQVFEEGTRMFAKVLEVRFLMAELVRRGE